MKHFLFLLLLIAGVAFTTDAQIYPMDYMEKDMHLIADYDPVTQTDAINLTIEAPTWQYVSVQTNLHSVNTPNIINQRPVYVIERPLWSSNYILQCNDGLIGNYNSIPIQNYIWHRTTVK